MTGITILAGDGSAFLANLKDEHMSEIGKALGQPKVPATLKQRIDDFYNAAAKCAEFWGKIDEAKMDARIAEREGKPEIMADFKAKETAALREWAEWRMAKQDLAKGICRELGIDPKLFGEALR